jgi:hypothetical protein
VALFGSKDNEKVKKTPLEIYEDEVKEFLFSDENIEDIYPLILDFLCLTNKRMIFVDKDFSFKEPKTTIYSVPYNQISGVGLEKNEKVFAFTDELILSTRAKNFNLKLVKGTNIKEVYNKIVKKIL